MIQPANGDQSSPRSTPVTRRIWLRVTLGSLVALAMSPIAPAVDAGRKKHKKHDQKKHKKQDQKADPEWWKGTWTTYHGTDMIPAGTLTLRQSGNKITGALVDPDGVSLPINGGTAGDRGREVRGLMYNARIAINIQLKLTGDSAFSGYYWVSGSPPVP